GWVDDPGFCRSADRYVNLPSRRDGRIGLRVARVCLVPPPVDHAAAVNKFKAAPRATAAKLPPGATDRPVKVFILAGDSNMAGRAKVGLLKYQANQPK